jgi:hypothetical protein
MLDLGIRALDDGPDIALDLCVSDCGTGTPPVTYRTGSKCVAKGNEKRKKYNTRFSGIPEKELCIPSMGRTGSMNEDTVVLLKRLTNAFALANPTTPRSCIASRFGRILSVAIQVSIAFNALNYRYTKMAEPRVVGLAGPGLHQQAPEVIMGQGVVPAARGLGDDWDDDVEDQDHVDGPAPQPQAAQGALPVAEGIGLVVADVAGLGAAGAQVRAIVGEPAGAQ